MRRHRNRRKVSKAASIKETVYRVGDRYYDDLLENIAQAKHSISIEMYIFKKDALGIRVQKALMAAAARGVLVRVLVDGVGTPFWGGPFTRQLESVGVVTRVFHPLPWGLWQWSRSVVRLPSLIKWAYLIYKINSRNHRKMFILDEKKIYISSMNIDQNHLSEVKEGGRWQDMGVCLESDDLQDALHAFEGAWDHRFLKSRLHDLFKPQKRLMRLRFNNTRHRRRAHYKKLLRTVARAKERIWITNAYFVPDIFLLKKLKEAAKRGVDVCILLPRYADISFMPWTTHVYYEPLLKSGVKIFEYLPSMLHAKTIIVDDFVMLGTSNLNHRSLLHDLEVDVRLRDPESKTAVEAQFRADQKDSQEIFIEDHRRSRPWYQRMLGHIIFHVRYWI